MQSSIENENLLEDVVAGGSLGPAGVQTSVFEDLRAGIRSFGTRTRRVAWFMAKFGLIVFGMGVGIPAGLLMLGAAVSALVTGVVYGYLRLVTHQYLAIQRMIVEAFVPEPEPEPGYFEKLTEQAVQIVKRVDANLLAILLVVTAILVSFWVLSGFLYYSISRITMRMRGIQFEAMRPGSAFTTGEIPKCQVQIMVPGLLMDSHQGYGIRIQNWLVVPLHVVSSLRDVLLVGPRGKLFITVQFEESRLHPDVAYIYIDARQWVTLGNSTAATSPATSGYVRCTGVKGYSSGTVCKTRTNGVLKYSGSTISGMSGAAYIMSDKVLGMHTGAAGDYNLGVSTTLFVSELKYKTRTEAVYLPSKNNGEDAAFVKTAETWTGKFMDKLARDAALSTDRAGWSGSHDIDFDEQLEWDSATTSKANPIKLATLMMQQDQGQDGGETEYTLLSKKVIEDIEDLKERMVDVEDFIKATIQKRKTPKEVVVFACERCDAKATSQTDLDNHMKKHLKFKCDFCDIECQSEIRLANHTASSHKTIKGESAYPGDARVSIETKTVPFLGKRSSSHPRRKKTSRASSSSSESRKGSQQWETVLNEMSESRKSIEKLCEAVLKGMGGHNLATAQK